MLKVSQSKVKSFRTCRQQFNYKYVEEIRPKKKVSRPLVFGGAVHKLLEAHYNGEELEPPDTKGLFAAERNQVLEIWDEAQVIIEDYRQHWKNDLKLSKIEGKRAEHHFEIELMDDVVWQGYIDAIGIADGKRWLVEHKTYSRRRNEDERWRDLQTSTYWFAVEEMGWKPIRGFLWDEIWSKPPVSPHELQDGSLSQKSIDTLPTLIKRVLKERKEKPSKYPQLMEHAQDGRAKWFKRTYRPLDRNVASFLFDDFKRTVREMRDTFGDESYMNIGKHCSWCDYEPLCRARLQNLDVDYVRRKQYEKASRQESERDKSSKSVGDLRKSRNGENDSRRKLSETRAANRRKRLRNRQR